MFHQMSEVKWASDQQHGYDPCLPLAHVISNLCYSRLSWRERLQEMPSSNFESISPPRKRAKVFEEVDKEQTRVTGSFERKVEGYSREDFVWDSLQKAAEAVFVGECGVAMNAIARLSSKISPQGDATERVGSLFMSALASLIASQKKGSTKSQQQRLRFRSADDQTMQDAYLALNKLTPFIRFAHLTANQAILEAVEKEQSIHIVDFDIMQGLQWPPFMQSLTERGGGAPRLKITGMGSSLEMLKGTGARLTDFARSLGIQFEFQALHGGIEALQSGIRRTADEALVVNSMMQLHRLLDKDTITLRSLLQAVHSLAPTVVTVAEQELSHSHSSPFLNRFTEGLRHYSAIFDSLEAVLPSNSQDRLKIEQAWLGKEIHELVCCQASSRSEHHAQFTHWKALLQKAGFRETPHSRFATAQARLLLKLCYPSEGYQLVDDGGFLILAWQDTPLFSVSSWQQHSS